MEWKYKTASELQVAIDKYFKKCDKDGSPYTVEGLARSLRMDRRSLVNYSQKDSHAEFHDIMRDAKSQILQNVMERGLSGKANPAVTIFNLKNNFGYVDKQEHDVNNKIDIEQIVGMRIVNDAGTDI